MLYGDNVPTMWGKRKKLAVDDTKPVEIFPRNEVAVDSLATDERMPNPMSPAPTIEGAGRTAKPSAARGILGDALSGFGQALMNSAPPPQRRTPMIPLTTDINSVMPQVSFQPRFMNKGGRVRAGEPVVVGDTPDGKVVPGVTEMFVPDTSGTVVPGVFPTAEVPVTRDASGQLETDQRQAAPTAPPPVVMTPTSKIFPYAGSAYDDRAAIEASRNRLIRPPAYPNEPGRYAMDEKGPSVYPGMDSREEIENRDAMRSVDQPTGVYPTKRSHPEDETDPYTRRERLRAEGASKDSFGKRLLKGALRGLAGGGLGGAILGAAVESASPGIHQRLKTQEYLADTDQAIAEDQAIKKAQTEEAYRKAQTASIPRDDEAASLRIENTRFKNENTVRLQELNYERLVRAEEGKNNRAGNRSQLKEENGYLFRFYPNDPSKEMEPIIDPRTDKQAFNPANVAQEVTTGDGTVGYAKSGDVIKGKIATDAAGTRQDKSIAAQKEMTQLRIDAAKALKEYEEAQKSGRQADAEAAREHLTRLREQYKQLGAGASITP